LFFEELAFAADVTSVAFGDDVFAQGGDGFARDNFGSDGGLDRDLEHLARDKLAHLGDQGAASVVGEVAVDDDGERIDGVAADEDVELDHG